MLLAYGSGVLGALGRAESLPIGGEGRAPGGPHGVPCPPHMVGRRGASSAQRVTLLNDTEGRSAPLECRTPSCWGRQATHTHAFTTRVRTLAHTYTKPRESIKHKATTVTLQSQTQALHLDRTYEP